jgi:cytochrome c-type biogenesis protein CcmH/NrfG
MEKTAMKWFAVLMVICLCGITLTGCTLSSVTREEAPVQDNLQLKDEADTAYRKRQYDIAVNKYQQLTRAVPRDPEAWFKLGNIYARTHRPKEAIKAYEEAVLRDPRLSKAWHNMGVVYTRMAANAYMSLEQHAEHDDPLRELAIKRFNGLYDLMPVTPGEDTVGTDNRTTNGTEIEE